MVWVKRGSESARHAARLGEEFEALGYVELSDKDDLDGFIELLETDLFLETNS